MTRPTLIGAPVTGEAFYLEDGHTVRVLTRDAHGQVVEVLEGDAGGVAEVLAEDDRRHAVGHVRRRWSLLWHALRELPLRWFLLDQGGHLVERGRRLVDFRGEPACFLHGRPPHKTASTGHVTTRDAFGHDEHHHPALDPDDEQLGAPRELYASVYTLTWSTSPHRAERADRTLEDL